MYAAQKEFVAALISVLRSDMKYIDSLFIFFWNKLSYTMTNIHDIRFLPNPSSGQLACPSCGWMH